MLYDSISQMVRREKPKTLPVFIPTFNNPEYLQIMINQLKQYGLDEVIISDNWSTYKDMDVLLKELAEEYTVVKKFTNDGPREFDQNQILFDWLPEKFIVTDPDIGFNINLPKNFVDILSDVSDSHMLYKTGFALDIEMDGIESNIKDINFGNSHLSMYQWEQQFYVAKMGNTDNEDPIYIAPIDTTFCLVNKKYFVEYKDPMEIKFSCGRIGGNFIAQHYGWYANQPISEEGLENYLKLLPQQWSFTSNAIKRQKGL